VLPVILVVSEDRVCFKVKWVDRAAGYGGCTAPAYAK
jgi:hypothetical protein